MAALEEVLDRIETAQALQLEANATSLDLLQAVYRNPALSLHVRMRAAAIALPHEHPKLSAQAQWHVDGSFAERLDKLLEKATVRSDRARLNGDGSKVIEHEPQSKPSGVRRI